MRFAIGGTNYEIDLSAANAAAFRQQIAPYIKHVRRAGTRQRPRRTVASLHVVRTSGAWAKDQGIALSDRGRIPAGIVQQYQAATGGS